MGPSAEADRGPNWTSVIVLAALLIFGIAALSSTAAILGFQLFTWFSEGYWHPLSAVDALTFVVRTDAALINWASDPHTAKKAHAILRAVPAIAVFPTAYALAMVVHFCDLRRQAGA